MEWDYTLPRDEFAEYVWGGQWLTQEEVHQAGKKSPYWIDHYTPQNLLPYHRTWKNESEVLANVRPFHNTQGSRYGLNVENGRVHDTGDFRLKTALRRILKDIKDRKSVV
jgi:hypothetical protein